MIGMRNTHSPYRMRTENLLPKFESAKNPFAHSTKASQTVAPAKTDSATIVAAPELPVLVVAPEIKPAPTVMPTEFLFDDQAQPAVVPVIVKEVQAVESVPVAKEEVALNMAAPAEVIPQTLELQPVAKVAPVAPVTPKAPMFSGLMKKVNPLAYLPAREAVKPARPRTAVQTELSLERVKVVRNDLSDTDLEVIPAKLAGKPENPAPRLQPAARTEETALGRLTSRFFGAGQPQV